MSDCIRINSLEHLPIEETLLIHYTILCSGFWDLNQLSTAYRNVCDTEWTVMYPNFQHPRHTDFPLNIPNNGMAGTFAWNYGGIEGVLPENFDQAHSFLVQLSVFNFNCLYTGVPSTGDPSNTGSSPNTAGDAVDDTKIRVPQLPPSSPPPRPPDPPVPGDPRGPGIPGDRIFDSPNAALPTPSTTIPPNGDPTVILTTTMTTDPQSPWTPIGTTPIGGDIRIRDNTIDTIPVNPVTPTRPTESIPGRILDSRFIVDVINTNPTVIRTPSVSINDVQLGAGASILDTNSEGNAGNIAVIFGQQGLSTPPTYTQDQSSVNPIRQINTASVITNAVTNLIIHTDEVVKGGTLVIAGSFTPPVGVELSATANLYVIDAAGITNNISQSYLGDCTINNSLQIGVSFNTANLSLGQATFVLTIENNNSVVGIATRAVAIRTVNTTDTSSNPLVKTQLASAGRDRISNDPIIISHDGDITLIATNRATSGYITFFYESNNANNIFSLQVTNPSNGNVIYEGVGRSLINNIEYEPSHSHASIINLPISSSLSQLSIKVRPITNSTQTNSKIYLSDGFAPVSWSVSSTTTSSITLNTPFANEVYKLIIHGFRQGYIGTSYTLYTATSNSAGVVVFSGLPLVSEYYYSVIIRGSNNYNIYSNIVYSNQYI